VLTIARSAKRSKTSEEQAPLRRRCRFPCTERLRRPREAGPLVAPRSWEEERPPRGGPARPRRGSLRCRRNREQVFGPEGGSTRTEGREVLCASCRGLRAAAAVRALGLGRVRGSKVRAEKASEERKLQESSDRRFGATRIVRERTRKGNKASKRVQPAVSVDSFVEPQVGREASLRRRGKAGHSRAGIQASARERGRR